ncbi:MAG: response regulator [Desulfocapsaceae bacterium]|nr:response regulator [Desulfocapsaceae bacterium]
MCKKYILLVDEKESILVSISWALEKNNFIATAAADGQKAIEELRAREYGLVITDLFMPRVDGIGVLTQAKRLYPNIGVIILTRYPLYQTE